MTNPERSIEFNEVDAVNGYILELKNSMKYFDTEIAWKSSDGAHWYLAAPHGAKPSPQDYRLMTLETQFRSHNRWNIMRINSTPNIRGEFAVDGFFLILEGGLAVTSHDIPFGADDTINRLGTLVTSDASSQYELRLDTPGIEDYAILENALHDLAAETALLREAYCAGEVAIMSLAARLAGFENLVIESDDQ